MWTYVGLDTTDMASRIATYSEFSLSDNVDNIARMESQTIQGYTIEKLYFQPTVSIDLAISQVVSCTNSIRAVMPPGVQPPIVLRFSASSQPIIQIALSSATVNGADLYDYSLYRLRQTLQTTPGATIPTPYGGAPRQIQVDLDLHALQANGMTPNDVVNAVTNQNVIAPSGLAKFGSIQYPIRLDAAPEPIPALNDLPIRVVDGIPVRIRDVAWVRDGSPPQLNYVSANGTQAVLTPIYKAGEASTLTVNDFVRSAMPIIRASTPKGVDVKLLFDQSVFVSEAIFDVIREASDRRRAHRACDLHLPGLVALDARRARLDPAVDPDLAHRALAARRDDQRDDARRPGARGRHPRRRRDGGDREHLPL